MPPLHQLSTAQLRQALQLSEQIDTMQQKLEAILGGAEPGLLAAAAAPAKGGKRGGGGGGKGGARGGKRTMSSEGRAKIAAAARLRWAKLREGGSAKPVAAKGAKAAKPGKAKAVAAKSGGGSGGGAAKKPAAGAAVAAAPKKKGGLTPEGRAKLAAAMKARWETRRKGAAGG